jgi:hypothetical protein
LLYFLKYIALNLSYSKYCVKLATVNHNLILHRKLKSFLGALLYVADVAVATVNHNLILHRKLNSFLGALLYVADVANLEERDLFFSVFVAQEKQGKSTCREE